MQSFGGVLPIGRHRGQYFEEVRRDDPEYCAWARGLLNPKGANIFVEPEMGADIFVEPERGAKIWI